ncbi:MAG: AI-2E family transporter [Anaerolineae bacterium]|nr:AI-2E family transporter [Anaerolineae bacterium]
MLPPPTDPSPPPMQGANLTPARWVLIAATIIATLVALWTIRSILLLTLASVILVVLFTIPTRFLERHRVRRTPAIILSVVFIAMMFALISRVILPTIGDQFVTLFIRTIPEGIGRLFEPRPLPFVGLTLPDDLLSPLGLAEQRLAFAGNFIFEVIGPVITSIQLDATQVIDITQQLVNTIGQISVSVLPFVGDLAGVALGVLIVLFMSLYFIADPKSYINGVVRLFPLWYRDRIRAILDRMYQALRIWLEGTFISMLFVAVATWFGLALLGIPQAPALGVLAAILSFVPNFGQLVAGLAAFVVGVVQAPDRAGWMLVVVYLVSFVQSQIFTPILFSESLRIPPVLVLLGQIVCGALFGFLGILLAVPITSIAMILIEEVYIHDVLGDRSEPATSLERQTQTRRKVATGENPNILPDSATAPNP